MTEMFAEGDSQEQMFFASVSQHGPIYFIASLRRSLPQFTHIALNSVVSVC